MRSVLPACILAIALPALAEPVSPAFTYQGEIRQGTVPPTGPFDLRFRLYDAAVGGTQLGPTLCNDNVPVAAGRFTTLLDFGPGVIAGTRLFLEIDLRADTGLGCISSAGFTTLGPRQELTAAPYAAFALGAATATTAQNASQLSGHSPAFFQDASNLSNGTLPDARLSPSVPRLASAQTFTGLNTFASGLSTASFSLPPGAAPGKVLTSDAAGVGTWQDALPLPYAAATSAAAPAFEVTTTGAAPALKGVTSNGGFAIHGINHSIGGEGIRGEGYYGLRGVGLRAVYATTHDGPDLMYGVYAWAPGPLGVGVLGYTSSNSGNAVGVQGQSLSPGGYGIWGVGTVNDAIYGQCSAAGRSGVLATNSSPTGMGVHGRATATSGINYGVIGTTSSASGIGVAGTTTTAGKGGYFESGGVGGTSLYSIAYAGSGTGYGVLGASSSGSGYGVYSNGRFAASGTKAFQIDHPLDPAGKYLNHYCAEGPEPLNVYSGIAVCGDDGSATVSLPPYFHAINRDPRYQLTCIGGFAPVYVASKIEDNIFRIAGGRPGLEVSWEVKARRNDAFVRAHGAPVELDKPEHERGRYLHPELYSAAPSAALFGRTPVPDRDPPPHE